MMNFVVEIVDKSLSKYFDKLLSTIRTTTIRTTKIIIAIIVNQYFGKNVMYSLVFIIIKDGIISNNEYK